MVFKKSFSDFDRFFSNFHFRWTITNKKRREDDDDFFIIMLALFSFRLFPLESFLHFKGKIMVIIIIPAVVFLDTVVCMLCWRLLFWGNSGYSWCAIDTDNNYHHKKFAFFLTFPFSSCLKCPLVWNKIESLNREE